MADNDIEDDTAPEADLSSVVYVPDGREDQVFVPREEDYDPEAEALMEAASLHDTYENPNIVLGED